NGTITQSLARSGGRKDYSPPTNRKIFESIRNLDHEGMELIEQGDHAAFCKYLSRTKNTICGRHPIGVLLAALEVAKNDDGGDADDGFDDDEEVDQKHNNPYRIQFVHYAQSSSVLSTSDSSVSYASAFVQQED
ncbi:Protein memo1, partial [Mortierella sp. GBA30]